MTPRTRDPEAKRASLLAAGLQEFAGHGLAATTVDAIAARAGCSTGLIYRHFGSKEALFTAVLDDVSRRISRDLPITPDDLPGYAARLYDLHRSQPEVLRFVAWYQLERAQSAAGQPNVGETMRGKVDAIRAAQQQGAISSRLDAGTLVLALQSIALMWMSNPADVTDAIIDPGDTDARREAVIAAAQQLIAATDDD